MKDVTAELLDRVSGPGPYVALVKRAKGAKNLTPALTATLAKVLANDDRTFGAISNALAYSRTLRSYGKSGHANLIRLIKGGHLRIIRHDGSPPPGSNARRDAPYDSPYGGVWYYELQAAS